MIKCLVGREFTAKDLDNNESIVLAYYSTVYVLLNEMDRAFRLVCGDSRFEVNQEMLEFLILNGNLVFC